MQLLYFPFLTHKNCCQGWILFVGFYFQTCAQPQSSLTVSLWVWLFREVLILQHTPFSALSPPGRLGFFLLLPITHKCKHQTHLLGQSLTVRINIEAFSFEEDYMVPCSQQHSSINHPLCTKNRWYVFHTSVLRDKS